MSFSKIRRGIRRQRRFKRTNVCLVSHPKSGRTWLRVMLCRYFQGKYQLKDCSMVDVQRVSESAGVLSTCFSHDQASLRSRLMYDELVFATNKYADKKVIFLARDLKDTIVSTYHQATKRNVVFEGGISDFVKDERFGARKIARFYKIWMENRKVPREFLWISYEQLHEDSSGVLRRVLQFMGEIDVCEKSLALAVDSGRFDNMRKVEASADAGSSLLRPGNVADKNSYKTRKGKVGGYKDELSEEDIAFVDAVCMEEGLSSLIDQTRLDSV